MKIKVSSSAFYYIFGKDKDKINLEDLRRLTLMSDAEIKKIVSVLEESSIFTEAVIGLRKKYNVPKNFNILKTGKNTKKISKEIFPEVNNLTRKLRIPNYFNLSILSFIMCGLFFIPQRIPLGIYFVDKDGIARDKDFLKLLLSQYAEERSVFLEIKEQMSKTKLHNLIDEVWVYIEYGMKLNLFKRPQNRMMRTELAKRIAELRDIQKLPFGRIASTLQKENPNVELYDILNEDYVKILYYRWKKKTNPQKVTTKG